uniref:Expressed conserved protein n=1 Tax=Echinococcus granulosus TaxID=6210 RepID=A0A068WGF3_ECHGR|nr:hypothetical protein EgrG_000664700 [Echinococcus granulosus]
MLMQPLSLQKVQASQSVGRTDLFNLSGSGRYVRTSEAMQKWLDDQITLVSGAQVKPTPPVPRPAPTSRSPSKHIYRNKKKWENNNLRKQNPPSGARKSSCKTSQRRKSFSNSLEASCSGRNPKKERKRRSRGRNINSESTCKTAQMDKSYSNSTEDSFNGELNRPYAHQSRSSSSDGERYDVKVQRSSSIQSVLSSLDSAGGLLLGRHVLAPRRDHGNRLYLGVIKTQKRSKRFGVVFCIPYAGHGGEESLEYCMQEVEIDDIFSYTDLYRHAVCEKDDVLVPACLLQPRDGDGTRPEAPVDPPYAGQPYVLAVVYKGFEPRSSRASLFP